MNWHTAVTILNIAVAVGLAALGTLPASGPYGPGVWIAATVAGLNALARLLAPYTVPPPPQ